MLLELSSFYFFSLNLENSKFEFSKQIYEIQIITKKLFSSTFSESFSVWFFNLGGLNYVVIHCAEALYRLEKKSDVQKLGVGNLAKTR